MITSYMLGKSIVFMNDVRQQVAAGSLSVECNYDSKKFTF